VRAQKYQVTGWFKIRLERSKITFSVLQGFSPQWEGFQSPYRALTNSVLSTEEERRDLKRKQQEFDRAWETSHLLLHTLREKYFSLEGKSGTLFRGNETYVPLFHSGCWYSVEIHDLRDVYQAIYSRLNTLRRMVLSDRKNILVAVGEDTPMVPPEKMSLSPSNLQKSLVNNFITRYGGDTERMEGKTSWAESVLDWVELIESCSEKELTENTQSSLELWNKERVEYYRKLGF